MNKNQIQPRDLLLFPESKQAIESMLESPLESALVFAETGNFGAWLDFAVWEKRPDEKVVETIMLARLSGEPDLVWKKAALEYVNQKRNSSDGDSSIFGGKFVRSALDEYEALHGPPKPQQLEWVVEKSRVVGPEKFRKVEHLISQIGGDCEDLLGTDSSFWILRMLENRELAYATKSWGGTIDALEYRAGGIFKLVFEGVELPKKS